MIPNVLSIAGSDPSGGAGIQADLKTFAALGAYGAAVITALTAQNTRAVTGVHVVPPEFVGSQIDAVFDDVRIDAVKLGMLAVADIVRVVASRLRHHGARHVVVDPVMVAKSGDHLLDRAAVDSVRELLLPLAFVVTPNTEEAGVLLGRDAPTTVDAMRDAARALHALGPRWVYLKGGHLGGADSPDVLFDGERFVELAAKRIDTKNTHGTGCTLSSAIAALLPQRATAEDAFRDAKAYLTGAIAASGQLDVGSGHGPVHHGWRR